MPQCVTLSIVSTLQIQEHLELAPLTTLGVGGSARFYARVQSESQLQAAVEFARSNRLLLFALGGGSNLLVHDGEYPGLVLHLDLRGEVLNARVGPHHELTVPAGTGWDDLVRSACEQDLSGMECLAGIPGLTGGAPVQNIGAYGQEVSQTITRLRAFDLQSHSFVDLEHEACRFRYRSSLFNKEQPGRYLITAVTFALTPGGRPPLSYADLRRHFGESARSSPLETYHAVHEIRRAKGMVLIPGDPDSRSAGSFFKNPVVPAERLQTIARTLAIDPAAIPHWPAPLSSTNTASAPAQVKLAAAWLVEQAGFGKGFALGGAGISSRHTLAIINRTGASTFGEIAALRDRIRSEVRERFNVELEQEPVELDTHAGRRLQPAG